MDARFSLVWALFAGFLLVGLFPGESAAEDQVTLKNGKSYAGAMVQFTETGIVFKVQKGRLSFTKDYSLDEIKVLVVNGKAIIGRAPSEKKKTTSAPKPKHTSSTKKRTPLKQRKEVPEAQVRQLIDKVGAADPPWLKSVKGTWPGNINMKGWGIGGWNKNRPDAYCTTLLRPNASKHKLGVKFMMACLAQTTDQTAKGRICFSLGNIYMNSFNDAARSAYWIERCRNEKPNQWPSIEMIEVRLATAYYRLGSKTMAMKIMNKYKSPNKAVEAFLTLLIEMGEYQTALDRAGNLPAGVPDYPMPYIYLAGAEAARLLGKKDEALAFYKKIDDRVPIVAARSYKDQKQKDKAIKNANDMSALAADARLLLTVFGTLDLSKARSGTFVDKSQGYIQEIVTQVVIRNKKIVSVKVMSHKEDRAYNSIEEIPARIVKAQSLKVDAISGATMSSKAIVYGAAKALDKAIK